MGDRHEGADTKLKMREVVKYAEEFVHSVMGKWDASHDEVHALKVHKFVPTLNTKEKLPPESMEIISPFIYCSSASNAFSLYFGKKIDLCNAVTGGARILVMSRW